ALLSADEPSALSVAIAIPKHGDERAIELRDPSAHFHVVLTNVSDKPQNVWREWCSWRYFNLTFEITDEHGKKTIAKKRNNNGWPRNCPDWVTLEPGETMVIDVEADNKKDWEGFPFPEDGKQTVTMRAVYEVQPDKQSAEHHIWTGWAISP